jgi:hypothetical protein
VAELPPPPTSDFLFYIRVPRSLIQHEWASFLGQQSIRTRQILPKTSHFMSHDWKLYWSSWKGNIDQNISLEVLANLARTMTSMWLRMMMRLTSSTIVNVTQLPTVSQLVNCSVHHQLKTNFKKGDTFLLMNYCILPTRRFDTTVSSSGVTGAYSYTFLKFEVISNSPGTTSPYWIPAFLCCFVGGTLLVYN